MRRRSSTLGAELSNSEGYERVAEQAGASPDKRLVYFGTKRSTRWR
jgi:hypothetical protein